MPLPEQQQRLRDRLVRKRGYIRGQLTTFKKYLEAQTGSPDLDELKINVESCKNTFDTLEGITDELDELEPTGDHLEIRANMSEEYRSLMARGRKLERRLLATDASDTTSTADEARPSPNPFSASATSHSTRLPEQALPKFDGKYEDWLDFQDDFQSSIGQRIDLSNTVKLKYLRSCLKGAPERLVKRFGTTNSGYEQAWTLLKKTYEHKAKIAECHCLGILEIPPMTRESPGELSEIIEKVEFHLGSLESLVESVGNCLLVNILLSKIDKATRTRFKQTEASSEVPDLEKLIEFLRGQVLSTDEAPTHKGRAGPSTSQPHKAPKRAQTFVTSTTRNCSVCQEEHPLFRCPDFQNLGPKEKHQAAVKASLCINCLRPGHTAKQCTSKFTCRSCSKKHHSWLHFDEPAKRPPDASNENRATCSHT